MAKILFQGEDKEIICDEGKTILQASQKNNIPHTSACGGRARCSTCRVMILDGFENLVEPNELESALISKKGFEKDIRLACQTKLKGDIKIRRLVLDEDDIEIATAESDVTSGREQNAVILFSDIRSFTAITEKNLPYDIIHMLGRYFKKMGDAILHNGGFIDKYMGDGILALFGLQHRDELKAGREAVEAALQMLNSLEELNSFLKKQFQITFNMGIGIHLGKVIIGEVGHPQRMQFTALGDNVNLASRIESMTKKAGEPLLISETLYQLLASQLTVKKVFRSKIRGKSGDYRLFAISGHNFYLSEEEKLLREIRRKLKRMMAPVFLQLFALDISGYYIKIQKSAAQGNIFAGSNRAKFLNNENLKIFQFIDDLKNMFPGLSYADIFYNCVCYALTLTGAPDIQPGFGRKDTTGDIEICHYLSENDTLFQLKERFQKIGFSLEEMMALRGLRSIGYHEGKQLTENPLQFSNDYFQFLLQENRHDAFGFSLLDLQTLHDEDCHKYIFEFALNEKKFLTEFQAAMKKIMERRI